MPRSKRLFRILASINRTLLPKLWGKDLLRLTPMQKAIVGYRYWVTRNAL